WNARPRAENTDGPLDWTPCRCRPPLDSSAPPRTLQAAAVALGVPRPAPWCSAGTEFLASAHSGDAADCHLSGGPLARTAHPPGGNPLARSPSSGQPPIHPLAPPLGSLQLHIPCAAPAV